MALNIQNTHVEGRYSRRLSVMPGKHFHGEDTKGIEGSGGTEGSVCPEATSAQGSPTSQASRTRNTPDSAELGFGEVHLWVLGHEPENAVCITLVGFPSATTTYIFESLHVVLQEGKGTEARGHVCFILGLEPSWKTLYTCMLVNRIITSTVWEMGWGSIHNRARFSYIASKSHNYSEMNNAHPHNIIIFLWF